MTKELVNEFIFEKFLPDALLKKTKSIVNVEKEFKIFLTNKGYSADSTDGNADEISEKFMPLVTRKIEIKVKEIESLGMPKILCPHDEYGEKIMMWWHKKYEEESGLPPLPESFSDVLSWIDSLSPRSFLIACAIILKLMGADKIFITDSPGDEGIDCLGLISDSPLQSVSLFVQSKTKNGDVSRDTVLMEYGKYLSLPHTKKYQEYRSALGIDGSLDGSSSIYIFVANAEFKPPAREVAKNLNILLRSRLQIAFWLSSRMAFEKIQKTFDALKDDLSANLDRNIASHIAF